MLLVVDCHGSIHCLYGETIELAILGEVSIRRASHVEADDQGRWWADLAPVEGPCFGPFTRRSEALDAEFAWLEDRLKAGDLLE